MRRFFNIFALAILALAYTACEKMPMPENNDGGDVIVSIPTGNYIAFQADANTRANLVTDLYLKGSFGVYAYCYDFNKNWDGQRAVAVPNLMWNWDKDKNKKPLEVTEDGGIYKYTSVENADASGQVAWQSGKKHAFFGYYPYEASTIQLSSMDAKGAPYLTYTVDKGDASKHVDVMTGHVYDITAASNQKLVTFKMNHRTAAVDVALHNAYQYSYAKDQNGVVVEDPDNYDKPENLTYYQEDITLEIQSINLDFSNLKYESAKIFLEYHDTPDTPTPPVYTEATNKTANYEVVKLAEGKTFYEVGQAKGKNDIVTANCGTSMAFIPQEYNGNDGLEVVATIKFMKRRPADAGYLTTPIKEQQYDENGDLILKEDGTPDYKEIAADKNGVYTITKTSKFEQELIEGSRYYIVLSFTSAAVSINIVTAAAWDEVPVEYEFM